MRVEVAPARRRAAFQPERLRRRAFVGSGVSILLFVLICTNTGCPKLEFSSSLSAPRDSDAVQDETGLPTVAPGTSFEETEVVEPMFPVEFSEEFSGESPAADDVAAENATEPSAFLARPTVPYAAQAGGADVVLPGIGDLEPQIEKYVTKLEKNLEDIVERSDRFSDDADTLYRDAGTLAAIALAVGLSEDESKFKRAAPAIVAAAAKMEKAQTVRQAQAAMEELKVSLTSQGDPSKLRWTKIASLKPLMKAIPTINTIVKRNIRSEAVLKRGSRNALEGTAALAVIGQASLPNLDETIKPRAVEEWERLWFTFRDGALAINRTARDYLDGKAAFEQIEEAYDDYYESCNDCHRAFFEGDIAID